MKKITSLLLFLFLSLLVQAQLENSKWCIGRDLALIDFATSSGTAAVPLPSGASTTVGGFGLPASVSDSNGNLLFYTRANGARVYNSNYTAINAFPNLLKGAMGSLIVPVPNSNNSRYLIFSNDHKTSGSQVPSNHFYSSVINVSPSGEITVVPSKINRRLLWNIRPNMTSFYNPNDGKPYIVVFGQNDSDADTSILNQVENTLYIYRVDNEDTITQVEKQHFPYLDEVANFWDEIKVSPDLTKIGFNFKLIAPGKDDVFLLDLSVSCGSASVSNFRPLFNTTNGDGTGNSGFEFSPNSQLLYTADVSGIYQSDGLGTIIRLTPDGEQFRSGTGLQRGIDDKIYVSHRNRTNLDVIQRPNEIGINSDYDVAAIPFQREGLTGNHLPALVPVLETVPICQEDPCPNCTQSGIEIINSITPLTQCGAYEISVDNSVTDCYDITIDLGDGTAPIQLVSGITTLNYTANGTYEPTITLSQGEIKCFTRITEVIIDCFNTSNAGWPRTYGSSTGIPAIRYSNTVLVDSNENVYTMGSSLLEGDISHEDSTFSKQQGAYVMSHDEQGNLRWIQYFDQNYTENPNIGAHFKLVQDGVIILTDKGYLAKYDFDGTLVFGFIPTDNIYTDFNPSVMDVDELTGDIYISRMRINDGFFLKKYNLNGVLVDTYNYTQVSVPPHSSGYLISGFDVVGERNLIIITGFSNTEVVLENGMSFVGNFALEVDISNNNMQINSTPMSLLPYNLSKIGYDLINNIIYFDRTRNSGTSDLSFIGYTHNSLYNTQNIIFIGHNNSHGPGHINIDQQTGNAFMKDTIYYYHLENGELIWEINVNEIQTSPNDITGRNDFVYITGIYNGTSSNAFEQHFPSYVQGGSTAIYITKTNNTTSGPVGFTNDTPNNDNTSILEESNNSTTLKAFPNPFSDTFYIKSTTEENIKDIEIFNVHGVLITSQKYLVGQPIKLQEGVSGIYFIKIHMKDGSVKTLQMIKK